MNSGDSDEEFATWWREREAERFRRRPERPERAERLERHRAGAEGSGSDQHEYPVCRTGRRDSSQRSGPRSCSESVESLSCGLVTAAGCRTERGGHRWWVDESGVRTLAEERSRWLSFADAAELFGCSEGAIKTAVNAGRLRQRDVHRSLPSLDRESVVKLAGEWAARKQRRIERAKTGTGPPDDGDVWLDMATAALVLGISRSRLSQLTQANRLPCPTQKGRRWFRRGHIEQAAAARALAAKAHSYQGE